MVIFSQYICQMYRKRKSWRTALVTYWQETGDKSWLENQSQSPLPTHRFTSFSLFIPGLLNSERELFSSIKLSKNSLKRKSPVIKSGHLLNKFCHNCRRLYTSVEANTTHNSMCTSLSFVILFLEPNQFYLGHCITKSICANQHYVLSTK